MAHTILTVDDSKMVRMIVAKTFQPFDCQIHEAASGGEGISKAQEVSPDLIFLDITMGDMTGFEALEQMRKTSLLSSTPVIMLTAESGNKSIERADQLKVAGYISKPFKAEQLVEQAQSALKNTLAQK